MTTRINQNPARLLDEKLNLNRRDVQLQPGDTLSLKGDQRGRQITALNGIVWVSQSGDLEDHLLRPGERFTVTRRGMIVLEGISDSRVRILGRTQSPFTL